MLNNNISENLEDILKQISDAAKVSGRSFDDIQLVAVSKKQSNEKIKNLLQFQKNIILGENYVQEFLEKKEFFSHEKWHFIGRLQKNKIRKIVGQVELIHSVDRINLLKEIDRIANAHAKEKQNILLQINIGKEESKSGILPENLYKIVAESLAFQNISVKGLMALPPQNCNESQRRNYFSEMRNLLEKIQPLFSNDEKPHILSMGTSGDFTFAIEEGANMVRIGTSLFGERI